MSDDETLARIAERWAAEWLGDGMRWGGDDSRFEFEAEGFKVECFETSNGAAGWRIARPGFATKRGRACPTLEAAMREAWTVFAEVVRATGAGTPPDADARAGAGQRRGSGDGSVGFEARPPSTSRRRRAHSDRRGQNGVAQTMIPPPDKERQPAPSVEAPNGAGTAPAGTITASGHEIIHALLGGIGAEVRENMGIAMAALMLKKSRADVTGEEAASVLHDALKIPDPVRRAKVVREGDRAMLATLARRGIVPEAYAKDFTAALTRLDEGEIAGILTPSG